MERDLTALAGDARGLLGRYPREARRVLQTLLVDRLECAPFRAGPVTGYRFGGAASYGGLLAGAAWPTNSGGPNGLRSLLARPSTWNSEGGLTSLAARPEGIRAARRFHGCPLAVEELHVCSGSSSWTRFPSGSFKVAIRTLP
jgi:hypothetical protein